MPSNLIGHNPLLKKPILIILTLCEEASPAKRIDIENKACDALADAFARQTPATVVDILIRNEALSEEIHINGKPYEGTLQDAQTDVAVDEDATIEQYLSITDTGKALLHEYAGSNQLQKLLADRPEYASVFITMLKACDQREGCSRAQLEASINHLSELSPDSMGTQKVYPQYFIDSLETAGGITWQNSWFITEAGRAVM